MYKIDEKQNILLSTGDYSHYFVIINEYNLKILNHYAVYPKLIKYCKSTILQF